MKWSTTVFSMTLHHNVNAEDKALEELQQPTSTGHGGGRISEQVRWCGKFWGFALTAR